MKATSKGHKGGSSSSMPHPMVLDVPLVSRSEVLVIGHPHGALPFPSLVGKETPA